MLFQYEKEQQSQELQDMELSAERERLTMSQKLELDQLAQEHKMGLAKLRHNLSLKDRKEGEALLQRISAAKAENEVKIYFLPPLSHRRSQGLQSHEPVF